MVDLVGEVFGSLAVVVPRAYCPRMLQRYTTWGSLTREVVSRASVVASVVSPGALAVARARARGRAVHDMNREYERIAGEFLRARASTSILDSLHLRSGALCRRTGQLNHFFK